jgi:predicted ABC-type exoprotein transport system permease subunit
MMNMKSARRALADSTLALIAACAAIAMFLPPMLTATVASVPRTVAVALVIALALPLHWILLGMAARRMDRSIAAWVSGAVLLFPIGGAAALILLSWLLDEEPQGLPAASH